MRIWRVYGPGSTRALRGPRPSPLARPLRGGGLSRSRLTSPYPSAHPHPIDAFIVAKLTASGLSPAPQADRLTLIKRAAYDLHGLPPTPEMVCMGETDRPFAGIASLRRKVGTPLPRPRPLRGHFRF